MPIHTHLHVCILALAIVAVGSVPAALGYQALRRRYGAKATSALQACLLLAIGIPAVVIPLMKVGAAVFMVTLDRWGTLNYIMACILWHGSPIYTAIDGPQLLSTVYGPLFYTIMAPVSFGPLAGNILAARFYGVLPVILGGLVIYRLAKPGFGRFGGWIAGVSLPLIVLSYDLLLHPDVWVFLLGALAASLFYRLMRESDLAPEARSSHIGLGLASGLLAAAAMYMKLTSVVLLAPVGALLVTHFRWRPAATAVAAFVFSLSIPWWPGMPFEMHHNLALLQVAGKHPLILDASVHIWFTAFWFLFPLGLLMLYLRWSGRDAILIRDIRTRKLTLTAVLSAFALLVFTAHKDGAEAHYLIPFAPILIAYARRISEAPFPADPAAHSPEGVPLRFRIGLAAVTLALLAYLSGQTLNVFNLYQPLTRIAYDGKIRAFGDELDTLIQKYRGQTIELGYGNSSSNWIYEGWQPKVACATNPPLFAAGSIDDRQRAGYPIPQATLDAVAEGAIQVWLLPNIGEPFSIRSNYTNGAELFPPAFRELFHRHYERVYQSTHFDVYQYRSNPTAKTGAPSTDTPSEIERPEGT